MKSVFIALFICLLGTSYAALAQQDDLFGTVKVAETHKGWIIGANGNFDIPAADMAKEFGLSTRIGPSVLYKTKDNWMFGVKADFIFGAQVHPDSFMINLKDKYGEFITEGGARVTIPTNERGYMIGLQAGKIVNTSKNSKDNGILFMTTVGFIQHKIQINNPDGVPALNTTYQKGYDRLTNGLFIEESIEYSYFAKSGLLNFHIGPDIMLASTQDRRDYLFDVMRPDTKQRLDVLFGIRGGWYFCIFKRKSEDILF
ncbi:MAG: hypothetical protein P4L41_05085 [Flavipsychrobacter sp.]|nr:hypothetical protein [Flavipsychrobacter sp.]